MKHIGSLFLFCCLLGGCLYTSTSLDEKTGDNKAKKPQKNIEKSHCTIHDTLRMAGLVNVQDINPNIRVHLRYSGTNNFLKQNLYDCVDSAFLQLKTAEMLSDAQNRLTAIDSSLHLLVWDGVRPRSVQWKMWNALKMPIDQKKRYVSNPRNGSIHNYGCAVDLTICDDNGRRLNMGTDFDYFGRAANTNLEYLMVNDGTLNFRQLDNRKLLRKVMTQAGFRTITSEWWHFNAMSRPTAKATYAIVE